MGSADAAGDDRPDDPPPLPGEADGVTVSLRRFFRLFPEAPDDPGSLGSDDPGSLGSDEVASRGSEDPARPGTGEGGSED